MLRSILHCDMNNFYASVECMLDPALKKYPIAVCGSVEERHGIVLAKNYNIKKYEPSSPVAKAYAEFAKEVSADGRKKERLHSTDAR